MFSHGEGEASVRMEVTGTGDHYCAGLQAVKDGKTYLTLHIH